MKNGSAYKQWILFIFLLPAGFVSFGQYHLKLQLRSIPVTHQGSPIFVAGNFNKWNPAHRSYQFYTISRDSIYLDIPDLKAGTLEFKFTRGDWNTVEASASGAPIENRVIELSSDTTLGLSIASWADDIAGNLHSISPNVEVLDTAFIIPQLNRTRRIWIYLPPGYKTGKKKYPVLYMQDGQNLFDKYTSGYGEWGVDECLDSLIKQGRPDAIVVGIDNGQRRINEYNPYAYKFEKGEGEEYVQFLVKTLKPYIDAHFRTLADKEHTIIAGSSLGALISYYAALRYPGVFGNAGLFSPSFWIAPKINALTDSLGKKMTGQFFFYAGDLEGDSMVRDMEEIAEKLGESSKALIYVVTDASGKHNEQSWHKWFTEFYSWIMGNGLSYQLNDDN